MIQIIPSLLTDDPNKLVELLEKSEGVVDRVHVDIIDGKFVDNKTINPEALNEIETELLLDFHLMVKEPVNWVEKSARAGADRIIGQIEKMSNQKKFVEKVQVSGQKAGLAIDLATPVSELDPVVLRDLDMVLVMSVKAGFGGQEFDTRVLKKISKLDEIRARDKTPYNICDDGGITLDVEAQAHYAGVDEVAVGRRLFKGNMAENIRKFQKVAHILNKNG